MKHRVKKGRSLSRDADHRKQLMRNLLTSLIQNKKVETTLAKGKELKREFDLLLNLAKRAVTRRNFSLKRKIFSYLTVKQASQRLFDFILPALSDRASGYLSLERTGRWRDDKAETVVLEFVNEIDYDQKVSREKASVASPRRRGGPLRQTGRKNS